ncbi:SNF2-related protein [Clostridium sp.]|uniref:DEAD/DEAH box helicase n=1 Tax=Clostridium sp. TaxID=1506 RepID=UPI003F3C5925
MNLELLKSRVLRNPFSLSYKNAEKIILEKNIDSLNTVEVNGVINIYGKINEGPTTANTHIKLTNNKIISLRCNCSLSEEARFSGNEFACQHIIATVLKLLEGKESFSKEERKEKVKLIVRLEEALNSNHLFNVILFIEKRGRVKVGNKAELNSNILSKNSSYSLDKVSYSKEEIKLFKLVNKLDFKVTENDLKALLCSCKYNVLQAKIDSIEYEGYIVQRPLPVKFTLKLEGDKIKLQQSKLLIRALNNDGSVYLCDRRIYIPPQNQGKLYFPIYNAINKKGFTFIKESSLIKFTDILSSIGELKINDDIKNLVAEKSKINLYFYKGNPDICCKFILEKNKEYIKESAKVKKLEEILYSYRFTKKDEEYLFLGEDEDIFDLLKSELKEFCTITSSKELSSLKILSKDDIDSKYKEVNNELVYKFNIGDISNEEFFLAIDSYNNGAEFYKFNNYSFLDFSNKEIGDLMKLLSFIGYKDNEVILPLGYEELIESKGSNTDFINIIKQERDIDKDSFILPRGLKAKLRDYQKLGFDWMQGKKEKDLFGILADEMGLGKTVQAIAFLLANKKNTSLVVTQTSLVYNWEAEFKKFAPKLKVACVHGSKSKRSKLLKDIKKYDVILTSYGTLNMDIENYKDILFENIIIDEAQTIKNSKAKITKSIKALNGKVRFALTGTPIENNIMELWSIFDFLKPGYLFDEGDFKSKFKRIDEDKLLFLKLIIKPFILRRTKKDVLKDLPDKNQWDFYVSMTEKQKKYYKSSLKEFAKEARETNNSISILALLTKLRQIAIDPSIVKEDYTGGSGKIDATLTLLNKFIENNKKTLVFSQFTSLLDKLKEKLDELDIEYYYLDGQTKASERLKLCNDFNASKDIKVFLISLKAGGTGLNLTSAEKVIHFDPWWNPAVENQATDRAHRIGQSKEVEVIKIISKGTIEEKMLKLKEEKDNLTYSLLSDEYKGNINNVGLKREDIEYLLSEE